MTTGMSALLLAGFICGCVVGFIFGLCFGINVASAALTMSDGPLPTKRERPGNV